MNSMFNFQRFLKTTLAIAIVAAFAGQSLAQSGSTTQQPVKGSTTQGSTTQGSATQQGSTTQQAQPASLQQFQQVATNNQTQLGLEGYCPVCVTKLRKWVIGKLNFPAAVSYTHLTLPTILLV